MMRVIRMVSSGAGIDQKGIQKNLLGFWNSFLSICRSKLIDPQTKICAYPCSSVKIKTFIQNTLFNLTFLLATTFWSQAINYSLYMCLTHWLTHDSCPVNICLKKQINLLLHFTIHPDILQSYQVWLSVKLNKLMQNLFLKQVSQ